jgi:hypothetical protein
MKNVKAMLMAAFIVIAVSPVLFAQEKEKEENHHVGEAGKGPHKGTIQEADPYHAEILVKDGKVYLFLLDGDAKPISNKGITASATFQTKDEKTITSNLMASGDDGFMSMDAVADFTNCIATFKVKGSSVSAKFKGAAAKATATAQYTCPMHPEVKSAKPGKCPKCGMALVEVKSTEKKEEHHHDADGHHH